MESASGTSSVEGFDQKVTRDMMSGFDDLRQTEEWAEYLESIGWEVVKIQDLRIKKYEYLYIKKIPLIPFSIAKLQRGRGRVDFENLKRICKQHRVAVVYLEPGERVLNSEFRIQNYENKLKEEGFRKSKGSYLPRKTIWIDLKKSHKKLLNEMKSKTRYNIGLAKRRSVNLKISGGVQLIKTGLADEFYSLLRQNARRLKIFKIPKSWFDSLVKSFDKKCFCILAFYNDRLVGGNFFMTSSNICFYSHNGSTELGRKMMAPSLCVWEGMVEAKRRGLTIFDFDGIYDGSKALGRWKGFSRFKKGFGGEEVEFVGQFVKWYWR